MSDSIRAARYTSSQGLRADTEISTSVKTVIEYSRSWKAVIKCAAHLNDQQRTGLRYFEELQQRIPVLASSRRTLSVYLSMPHLHHLSCLSDENEGSVLLKTVGDLTVLLKTVGDLTVLLKTVGEFLLCYCKQWECLTENLI